MNILNEEDNILKVLNEIDNFQDEELILTILNITSEEYINTIIKYIGYGQKKLCAQIIEKSEMFYQCFDCCKHSNHLICKECFIPEKHKNHAVFLGQIQTEMPGYCDCGDTIIFDINSLCPKHDHVQVQNQQLDDNVVKKYEQFLITIFNLLLKKLQEIIDYPDDLLENIENIINGFNNNVLKNYYNANIIHFQSIKDSMNQAKIIHKLIIRFLKIITTDNIIWGSLTGKILMKEYKLKIKDEKFESTSLLQSYIKYNGYLVGSLKLEEDISILFHLFFQVDEFRTYLDQIVTQNIQNLFLLIYSYQIITINNEEYKLQIYEKQIQDQKLNILIQQILANNNIKQIICEDIVVEGLITEKIYLFVQSGYMEILKLYQNTRNSQYYNLFDAISNLLLKIPLIDDASYTLSDSFCYYIELLVQSNQSLKGQINQIQEILLTDFPSFQSQLLNPDQIEFQKLQNESLLIYSLTRRYPCQQKTDLSLQSYPNGKDEQAFNYLLVILIQNLSQFRCILKSILLEIGNIRSNEAQNILRIILNYFFNNLSSSFHLQYNSPIKLIMSNLVLSDRNFIIVLLIYIMNFKNTKEAYQVILQISGQDHKQFRIIMHQVLKRAILNYIIFKKYDYYQGRDNYFKNLDNVIFPKQIDLAYIQIYAFLFQEQGINDIIQSYNEIIIHLKKKGNLPLLICKIASTDNDLIFCVENFIGIENDVQLQKGLHKLFQTIFYSQTFYQLNEMKSILQQFSNINYKDFQSLILSSCEKNQDNGQFQLKKELKLTIYEPIYAQQNEQLKERIIDKLQMQNDKYVELFGSSLEYELSYYNTDKSTLTNIRYEILKAISLDKQQYLLQKMIRDLQSLFQSKLEFDIQIDQAIKLLQDNAIYINLLILSNSFFKDSNNLIILYLLDKIKNYCQVTLLNQKLNYTQKLFFQIYCSRLENQSIIQKSNEVDQKQESKSKKHQQYKEQLQNKFNQMKDNFNNKINNYKEQVIQDTDETCLLCKLPFEQEDLQYQPILIQYTNIYQYLNFFKFKPTKDINILSIHISNCNHIFHSNCLQQQIYHQNQKNLKFQSCPLCLSPYNFILPSYPNIQNIEIEQFIFSIQVFLESLYNNNYEILYNQQNYKNFDPSTFLNEILSQILCNLTFQLLSDFETFANKNQHPLIQKIINIMRFFNINLEYYIDSIKLFQTEILFEILKLIQTHLITEYNIYSFQQKLQILFNPNFELAKLLLEVFTLRKIDKQMTNRLLPYDMQLIKQQFKQNIINKFTNTFSSFLNQNYLLPCQKKNCHFLNEKLDTEFQGQIICLICLKKMCLESCGKTQKQFLGNFQRHSQKKHFYKCVFLNVEKSEIILTYSSSHIYLPNTLYTDIIGESPIKGTYPLQHYNKFQINMKTLDQIFEIIFEEKYLNKINENSKTK